MLQSPFPGDNRRSCLVEVTSNEAGQLLFPAIDKASMASGRDQPWKTMQHRRSPEKSISRSGCQFLKNQRETI